MSAEHPIPLEGETGYPWPCIRCGRIFTPRRLTALPTAPMAKCCGSCAWQNLLTMLEDVPGEFDEINGQMVARATDGEGGE